MGTFRDLVKQANAKARANEQVLALAHLYTVVLDELAPSGERYSAASTRITEQILPQLSKASRGYPKDQDVATFAWQDAERSYLQYSKGSATDTAPGQSVLEWLLKVDFTDTSQKWCREACRRAGLLGAPQPGAEPTIPELGFGRPLESKSKGLAGLFGRDSELTKHLGFLTLALQQNSHYLLVGKPGVGKSFFLEHLLTRATSNAVTSGRNFVLFGRRDFWVRKPRTKNALVGSMPTCSRIRIRFPCSMSSSTSCATHPIWLSTSRRCSAVHFAGGGRTFVLVCDSAVASSTPLLKGLRPCSLPPLPVPAARQMLLEERLPELVGRHDFGVEPSPEALVDALLNTAPQRYPGRFMPELAIHLAESAINRARHRIQFLQQAPLTSATVEDLWAHVVEEQGLNPEIFGKDPKEFYANLRSRLDNKVIGQNHAVAQICSVLEMQAHRPPQRAPRGRFLFVGPRASARRSLLARWPKSWALATRASSCSICRNIRPSPRVRGSWALILATLVSVRPERSINVSANVRLASSCSMKSTARTPAFRISCCRLWRVRAKTPRGSPSISRR